MRWSTVFSCALAVSPLVPAIARADPPPRGEMIVYLTGGKEVRGSIVEMDTGKYYVVVRGDGVTLKIPWSAVRAISPPSGPRPPPEASTEAKAEVEPATPEPPRASPVGPVAFVEIRSEKRIQLQWSAEGADHWETACMSPCNVALPLEGSYRVVDQNGRPGKPFRLPHDGKVVIQSIPRSGGTDALGGVALGLGTIALYGGALATDEAGPNDSGPAVAMVFGLSAIALGTVLLLVNGSSVQIDGEKKEMGRFDPAPRRALERNGPPLPRALSATLFTVHF